MSSSPDRNKNNSHNRHQNNNGMHALLKNRRSDLLEEYEQEFESYQKPAKRKRAGSESSDDDKETDQPAFKQSHYFNEKSNNNASTSNISQKGWDLMAKVGYKSGSGLGSKGQGRVEPVETSTQRGRLGLGHEATKVLVSDSELNFNANIEIKCVEEVPQWLECSSSVVESIAQKNNDKWIVITKPKRNLDDEDRYCDKELINELTKNKSIFDHIKSRELNEARARANPYETVKAGFFQNRAAMKTANIDRVFGWSLSREFDRNNRLAKNPLEMGLDCVNTDRANPIFYFADVCAGPGGFSEYMLWRKGFYNAKGFGFTLTGRDDFKLNKFKAASPEYFETYYGVKKDGNVMDPMNLSSLEQYVKSKTHGAGVHLVMCDGGFSVEGQENIQEILSKRLYLCQFIVGLSLARAGTESKTGGNFLCKLFDIFTPFSMGLIYLMHAAFKRISIHKPITSRPANSERYIFCENLTDFGATVVKDYLTEINNRMNKIANERREKLEDVYEIVPADLIRENSAFYNYVVEHIANIAQRQIFYLQKYLHFTQNKGAYDADQGNIRDQCLSYWELPNIDRSTSLERFNRPFTMSLNKLTSGRILLTNYQAAPFTLDVLNQSSEKHVASSELRAILLPEASEPMLLVSNGGTNVGVFKNENFERLSIAQIPYDTVLLVQETDKYELNGREIVRKSKLLYIIDAAVLNGDDVSNLPLSMRLMAAKKFCDTINKDEAHQAPTANKESNGQKNFKKEDLPSCDLVCAMPIHVEGLVEMNFETRKFKGADIAVFNINGKNNVISTCRAIRFVNIFQPACSVFWSKTSRDKYVFDQNKNLSLKLREVGSRPEFYSSFFDCIRGLNANERSGPQTAGPLAIRSWRWSWSPVHERNFTVNNILNDENHNAGLTLKALKAVLELETYNINNC